MRNDDARKMAEKIARLEKAVADLQRAPQLAHSSVEAGAVNVYDETGVLRQTVGQQYDGAYTTLDQNGPAPSPPSIPFVQAHPGLLQISWDGTLADDSPLPSDFARVEVHVSTEVGFTPTDATQVATFTSPHGGSVAVALNPVEYHVALTAANTSGAESESSQQYAATPLPVATSSGNAVYTSATAPVGLDADDNGDLWIQPPDNLVHVWDGSAWMPLPTGPTGIADDAVQENHIGSDQVAPMSLQINAAGGPFPNLVKDSGFLLPEVRNKRLAEAAAPEYFYFDQVTNLIFGEAWKDPALWDGGPNATVVQGTDVDQGIAVNFNGVSVGEVVLSITQTPNEAVVEGRSYHFDLPTLWISNLRNRVDSSGSSYYPYFTVRLEWLDAAGAVLATGETPMSQTLSNYNTFDSVAPVGASQIRCSYLLTGYAGDTPITLAEAVGFDAGWGAEDLQMTGYGAGVTVGDWMLASDRDATVDAGWGTMFLTDMVPVSPDQIVAVAWSQQEELTSTGTYDHVYLDVSLRFYDAAGNYLGVDRSTKYGFRNQTHPEWAEHLTLYYPFSNAAFFQVWTQPTVETYTSVGTARLRNPRVGFAGFHDKGSDQEYHLTPRGMTWNLNDDPVYEVSIDADVPSASIKTKGGYCDFGGYVDIAGNLSVGGDFTVKGESMPQVYSGSTTFAAANASGEYIIDYGPTSPYDPVAVVSCDRADVVVWCEHVWWNALYVKANTYSGAAYTGPLTIHWIAHDHPA